MSEYKGKAARQRLDHIERRLNGPQPNVSFQDARWMLGISRAVNNHQIHSKGWGAVEEALDTKLSPVSEGEGTR